MAVHHVEDFFMINDVTPSLLRSGCANAILIFLPGFVNHFHHSSGVYKILSTDYVCVRGGGGHAEENFDN